MSNALQIARGLWQLKMSMVNAYLLATDDGLVLTKPQPYSRQSRNPGTTLPTSGIWYSRTVISTMQAALPRSCVAQAHDSYAHAADLELITKGVAERPGTTVTPGMIPAIAYRLFIKPGGTTYEAFAVDQTLEDGQTLPMAGNIEVIHSPGHCAGHIALLLRQEGILIAGDICSNIMGLSYSLLNGDRPLARQSLLRVAAYPFEQAVFGHGKLLDKQANQSLKERFSDPKLR